MKKNTYLLSFLIVIFLIADASPAKQKQIVLDRSSSQPDIINAMTFNIRVDTFLDGFHRWNNRKEKICDIMARNGADVIGVQEALDYQAQDIQNALPQYSNYFVGRDDGKQKGESCTIFYLKDRFKMDDSGTFWFSDTPEKPSKGWGAMWPRICSWVHLTEKQTGQGFYVYNVHLDVLSQNSRQKSAELLAQRIAARKLHDPFIMLGDFNMKLNNPAMAYLLSAQPKMTDALQTVRPDSCEKAIDHIPLGDGFTALDVKVDTFSKGKFPSDHFPLIAKLSMTKNMSPVAVETHLPKTVQN